jgi:hypothetical protein
MERDQRPSLEPAASIILTDMDRTAEASYGFRSWILQETDLPYEVILILFNDREKHFEALTSNAAPNCRVIIRSFPCPPFFNIAAANNLGIHFSTGKYLFFANSDVIHVSDYLQEAVAELNARNLHFATGSRSDLNSGRNAFTKACCRLLSPEQLRLAAIRGREDVQSTIA